jgi:hypothetical protein
MVYNLAKQLHDSMRQQWLQRLHSLEMVHLNIRHSLESALKLERKPNYLWERCEELLSITSMNLMESYDNTVAKRNSIFFLKRQAKEVIYHNPSLLKLNI